MLKFIIKAIISVFILIFIYLFSAILLTVIPVNSNYKQAENGTAVFITSNGVHTNIVLPVKNGKFDWSKYLELDKLDKYLAFGWGDSAFYMNTPTWDDLKFTTAFNAAFLPSKTIMQVYTYKKAPVTDKNTIKLILDDKQFMELSNYVLRTFKKDKKNQIIEIVPNKKYYFRVKFYPAKGKYSIFKTCNNWTNKGLKQAGLKTALWAPFDKSVLYHLIDY